jgi:hypothetical protein
VVESRAAADTRACPWCALADAQLSSTHAEAFAQMTEEALHEAPAGFRLVRALDAELVVEWRPGRALVLELDRAVRPSRLCVCGV